MIDYKFTAIIFFLAYVSPAISEESIEQLLHRLKITDALHYGYMETRDMELLSTPWQARGEIYITADTFYVHQLAPEKTLLTVSESELKYNDLESGNSRVKPLTVPYEIPGFGPLLRMTFGLVNADSLNKEYKLTQTYSDKHWKLRLTPQLFRSSGISRMYLEGPLDQYPQQLKLEFSDGDTTVWQFETLGTAETAIKSLEAMLEELNFD